jgi:hypothetical protein
VTFYEAFTNELEKIAIARITPRDPAKYMPTSGADPRSWYDKRLTEAKQQRFQRQMDRAPTFDPNAERKSKVQVLAQRIKAQRATQAQPVAQSAPLPQPPAPAPVVKAAPEQFPNIPNPSLKQQPQAPAQSENQGKAGPKSVWTRPLARVSRFGRNIAGRVAGQAGDMVPYMLANKLNQRAAEQEERRRQAVTQSQPGLP